MAWEREEVALASVGCCVRLWLPLVSISSSCSAEAGYREDAQGGSYSLPTRILPWQERLFFRASVTPNLVTVTTATSNSIQGIPKLPSEGSAKDYPSEPHPTPGGKKVLAPPLPCQGPRGWQGVLWAPGGHGSARCTPEEKGREE